MSEITKRALEQSLKNLLLKKPLNKITINDIAEDCGINRMTFYYHFKDIYDLVEWSCLEDAQKALKEKKTYDTWQEGAAADLLGGKGEQTLHYECVSLCGPGTGGEVSDASYR